MAKSAVVAIVGRTNAGKSTLVNRLVGEKVSIVSPVEQTTRNTIRGIVEDPRGQLVLLDTPGLHKAVGEFGKILNRMARRTAAGADILAVVFDASLKAQMEDVGWMCRVANENPEKVVFILNKCDKGPVQEDSFREAWQEAKAQSQTPPQTEPVWVRCSATSNEGAAAALDALFSLAGEGEALFPGDIVTDYPRRLAIADTIREKFLGFLHQELPHELGIAVKDIEEVGGRAWNVKVDVLVNRASQKPIVIGRGADTIKRVRKLSERELSEIFGVRVSLILWVRVEPGWMKNRQLLAAMGYAGGDI